MEKEKKVAEPEEVAEEQEYDSGDVDDEDVIEEESKETSQELEGADDERDGKQNQSASMSDRSESRSYSSVIRKCEVRKDIYRRNELKTYTIISNIQMLVL